MHLGKGVREMKLKFKLLIPMISMLLVICTVFTVIVYNAGKKSLLKGIDDKLLTVAEYSRAALGEDFHNDITGKDSISRKEFERIVEMNNRLCISLDLQYIWSVLVLDRNHIYFTSATSPGKDVTKGDHASFFELHSDPEAFVGALDSMKPNFTSFHNAWGHGRMVLVPYKDRQGRIYMFGASMGIDEVNAIIHRALTIPIAVSMLIMIIGVVFSFIFAGSISNPIVRLEKAAMNIATGDLNQTVDVEGASELQGLSRSVNDMSKSIKRMIGEIREGRERFRALAENTSDFVWEVDGDNRYTYASPKIGEYVGCEPEELIGKNRFAFVCERQRPEVERRFKGVVLARESFYGFEYEVLKEDGETAVFDSSGVPIYDTMENVVGFRGIDRDVTDREQHRVERENLIDQLETNALDLEGAKQKLEEKAGDLESANEELEVSYEELQTRNEEVESTNEELQISNEELEQTMRELQKTKDQLQELTVNLEKTVEVRTAELKKAEDVLVKSEKLALLGQLSGTVSHELRNPLGVIKNAAYQLDKFDKSLTEEKRQNCIQVIRRQVNSADRIISSILDFARPKPIEIERCSLEGIIDEVLDDISVPSYVSVEKRLDGEDVIMCDSTCLKRALSNIITNSVQAITDEGWIKISSERDGDVIVLTFEDNGMGIDDEDRKRIFEPLYSNKVKGVGLGLTIVKNIVEGHDGKVVIDSRKGVGTKITISLPQSAWINGSEIA